MITNGSSPDSIRLDERREGEILLSSGHVGNVSRFAGSPCATSDNKVVACIDSSVVATAAVVLAPVARADIAFPVIKLPSVPFVTTDKFSGREDELHKWEPSMVCLDGHTILEARRMEDLKLFCTFMREKIESKMTNCEQETSVPSSIRIW